MHLCVLLSGLCIDGSICAASKIFVTMTNTRNLMCSKKFKFNMHFLALIEVWNSSSSFHSLGLSKSDNPPLVL